LVVDDISDPSVADFIGKPPNVLFLSIGAAWIFSKNVIEKTFSNRLLNLHGTRLPQDRGGGGRSWQIMMGNRLGFCVLHQIDPGVDTGAIVASREFLYPPEARTPEDFATIDKRENLAFMISWISDRRETAVETTPVKQSEWFSSYWPRLHTETNGFIDWSLGAFELERFICAFDRPFRGASTLLNGQKVFLRKVSLTFGDGYYHPYQRGIVYRKSAGWVCVAVDGGSLIVEEITDEEGRNLLPNIRPGDRFSTSQELLEQGLSRVHWGPTGLLP
jgi:methionyl-tRNA formyltransferase